VLLTAVEHQSPHPRKKKEHPQPRFDRAVYHEGNAVERLLNQLKRYRRIPICYETRASSTAAMCTSAAMLDWLS
jgi:transposase